MRKLQLKTMLLMLLMAVGGLSPSWADSQTVTLTESQLATLYPNNEIANYFDFVSMAKEWNDAADKTDYQLTAGETTIKVNKVVQYQVSVPSSMSMFYAQAIGTSGNGYFQWRWDTGKGKYGLFNFGNARTLAVAVTKGQIIVMEGGYTAMATGSSAANYSVNSGYNTFTATEDGYIAFNASSANIRALAILNPSATSVDYTIKYVDENGDEIKTATTGSGDSGASITLAASEKASFYNNDGTIKYIYVSDDSEGKTISSDGTTVVTITFREAATWSYTVNNSLGSTLTSGSAFEQDNSATVSYPQYVLDGTTLYKAANNQLSGGYYQGTFAVTEDNLVKTIAYAQNLTDVVFYSEAEDIEGATARTGNNNNIRCSMGTGASFAENTKITSLPAGIYKISTQTWGGSSTDDTKNINFTFTAGEKTIFVARTTGSLAPKTSEEFTLSAETDIYVSASGDGSKTLDLVYIQKTGEYDPTDVTSLITNNSFETGDLTGWTASRTDGDTGVKTNVSPYTTEGIDGSYLFNTWNGDATGYDITQTLTSLAAGYYKLEALFAGRVGYTVDLVANDNKTTVTHTATGTFTKATVVFALGEAANVTIGAKNANSWYKADNFTLHTITAAQYLQPFIDEYEAALAEAQKIANMTSGISSAAKATVTTAIGTYGSVSSENASDYTAATAALNEAVAAAQPSINAYKLIATGTIPTDNATGWTKTTANGTLACNTWSNEGNSDGSGMTTPFIQDHIDSGTALGEGSLSYTIENLEPGEKYNVTALVRVFNEAAGSLDGASFFANNQSVDVDANGNSCTGDYATKGKYGLFTVKAAEVDNEGKLTFGIAIAEGSELNWVAIKNVTISEYADQKVESITLSKTTATLTTGDALTLTATVAPENADDKTFTWSSDNEAVATVNALGVVTALAAGNATITATANDGSGVTATCTVTVADAASIAYTTAISGNGKYLLRNVATGKYLNAGNAWGTQASLADHGVLFTATLNEGTYKLTDFVLSSKGLSVDAYLDQDAVAVTVNAVEGKTNVYTLSLAEGTYLAGQAGSTVLTKAATDATSSLAQWQFISEDDMKKNMTTATAENPIDMTYFIMDPNLSRNNGFNGNWTKTNVTAGGDATNQNVEAYHKTFSMSQTLTVPNGTYRLRGQAFYRQDGSDNENLPYFFANDQKVTFPVRTGSENSMSAASTAFSNGLYYSDYATVTVTDHTLTVGAKLETNTTLWCIWDNFSLEMIGYVPVTEITATIDKTEITEGNTATISDIAIVPAAASFNAYTITSDNEEVATVTSEGVVSAIKAGTANITIATEMENVTKVFAITVVEPVAAPESIALKNGEAAAADILLNGSTLTATLTAKVLPEDAPQTVVWSSSDETVATVVDGVIKGVKAGTATIYAKSTEDENISASVNVKVYMFKNQSFEADGNQAAGNGTDPRIISITGWTQEQNTPGSYQDNQLRDANTANASNYGTKVTPSDGNYYFFYRHGWNGSNYAKLTSEATTLPVGKYTLTVDYKMVSGSDNDSNNNNTAITLSAISGENTLGTVIKNDATKANKNSSTAYLTNEAWKTATTTFTLEESKSVQAVINLLACGPKRSDFVIDNVILTWSSFKNDLKDAIDVAEAVDVTTNVGTAAFQIPAAAATAFTTAVSDAQGVYNDAEAAETDYLNAIKALATATSTWKDPELNAPADGQLFNVILTYAGWTYDQKAMTYIANGRNDAGKYNIQYKEAANQNLAQAFTFIKVEKNNYKMSQIDADGVARYISTGVPYSGNTSQIRTVTDAESALVVTVIPTGTEGVWNLKNTEANQFIGSQDAGVYTVNNHINFSIVETTKPAIAINTTAAGWGTVMLPFAQALPDGVKAYSCAATAGDRLTLTEVYALEANKPYLVEGAWDNTVTGDAQGIELTYTDGLFTGVYANQSAPVGSYVLQKNNDALGFYKVAEGKQPTVKANRAYLTVPASARVAFFFGEEGETTSISALQSLSDGNVEIYNTNGVRIPSLQKGMNILKMSDGKIKKVMVK